LGEGLVCVQPGKGGDVPQAGVGTRDINLNIKPVASNQKLNNIIDNLYRGQDNPNMIGNGTTMDAVRAELRTGIATGNKFHTIKAQESISGLNNLLNKGNLSPEDANIAKALIKDLTDALSGK
jgi:hypothetical protein